LGLVFFRIFFVFFDFWFFLFFYFLVTNFKVEQTLKLSKF
jgi:hypothetical protein